MTRSQAWRNRLRGPRASLCISLPALAACLTAFALAPHDRLLEPLTLLLALCTLVATVAFVGLDDRLLVDASFVPATLAVGFLGPAPAFALVVIGELGSWCFSRYRAVVVPVNVVAVGAPTLGAAALFTAVAPPAGGWFYVTLGFLSGASLVVNDVILTFLIGLLDDKPVLSRLREHVRLVPAISINVLLALATAGLYLSTGLQAIAVVLLGIIAFNYMVTQMLAAQHRAREIAKLAASRQRLVVQALDAEDRQRRQVAEHLHDEVLQDLLVVRQDLRANVGLEGDARILSSIERAISELRGAASRLHPAILARDGLRPALAAVAKHQARVGSCWIEISIDEQACGEHDRLVFAVARELLTNVAKHARAKRATLRLWHQDELVLLDVRDDGRGFDAGAREEARRRGHIGLASVTERVDAVGGRVEFGSSSCGGAHVRVALPCKPLTSLAHGGPIEHQRLREERQTAGRMDQLVPSNARQRC